MTRAGPHESFHATFIFEQTAAESWGYHRGSAGDDRRSRSARRMDLGASASSWAVTPGTSVVRLQFRRLAIFGAGPMLKTTTATPSASGRTARQQSPSANLLRAFRVRPSSSRYLVVALVDVLPISQ
jgi:hypothetical protein